MLLASSTKPEREGEDKGNKEERGAQTEREREKTKTRKKEEKRDKGWQTLRAWSLEDNVSLKSAHLRIKKALK
jgi:hypothetical protein